MNPTALLKIIAALVPLMGDKEIGATMVMEIQAMFTAMETAAHALTRIDHRLTSIDQKLAILGKLPLDEETVDLLKLAEYHQEGQKAIAIGLSHYDAGITPVLMGKDDA